MFARFYKFYITSEYFDDLLKFFDEKAKPLIESVDGHLGIHSVRTSETECIMVSFYTNKDAAEAASEKAAVIFVEMGKWMSAPPEVMGEGEVLRSLNLGH
ncbi:MAG: hypothetical protein CMM46_03175 [Rhodospirillaceae bacterium]|nr:hypothetical protein [Rhodospirillaceae bacterium]|tara:strand:- start:9206 stop:9505 length:300 start_codon:yes stop_codon:yes gene_type:complete